MPTALDIVNPVPVDEAEGWLTAVHTTLLGSPWGEDFPRSLARWRTGWDADRTWGARDRGRWVATLETEPHRITVPGPDGTTNDLLADAVTAVTVAATHRRRGLLTRMIGASLDAAVERGDAVSVLIAAEWPIYGRYGYASAARAANYTLYPKRAGAVVAPDPDGIVRQADVDEVAGFAPELFERARRRWAGQIDRPGPWWPRRLGTGGYDAYPSTQGTWIVHESDDGVDGLLGWRVTRDFELDGDLGAVRAMDLTAASDRAYRNLWAYLTGLDVIGEIELQEFAVDEPVRWLLDDGRALKQTYVGDQTWLRLLDVPTALSARGYAVPGRVVLEVVDADHGNRAAGRYLLDADEYGNAVCSRTDRSADLVLPQRTLAAAYLGDRSIRSLAVAGGVDELTAGALTRTDAMFSTPRRPWNATPF